MAFSRTGSAPAETEDSDACEPPAAEARGEDQGGDVLDFEPGARAGAPAGVPDRLVATFLQWFAGRADVYAKQWYDARRDRSGYWPVREPLTPQLVQAHLLGRLTLGQYVLHLDETVPYLGTTELCPVATHVCLVAATARGT